jgi:L-ribulose-5-phosphate 4-epimerase
VLTELKRRVLAANLDLAERGLAAGTWGNVSGVDRETRLVVIKPSGVRYDALTEETLAVVSLDDGEAVAGLRASSDTSTHLELYRAFAATGGVAHTHSTWATIWAQACRPIPCLGTTHADHFRGAVPVTRALTDDEIAGEYERATGTVLVETFAELDPEQVPAALVAGHGAFAWGEDPAAAVENAAVLEQVAFTAFHTLALDPARAPIDASLRDRHFLRKHGTTAYYGQPG